MADLGKKPVAWLLPQIVTALTLLVAGARIGVAEEIEADASTMVAQQPATAAEPGASFEHQYWVVSTRRCPQDRVGPVAGPIDYFHRSPGGRLRRSDATSFAQSFEPGVPICMIVHGSFVSWEALVNHSRPLHRWIRGAAPERPLHVVFVSWPSDGPLSYFLPLDIAVLGRRSALNGFYLADIASRLPESSPITFVGHSHGARLISSALHLMGGGSVQGYRAAPRILAARHRVRAVLFAAAMDHPWLNPGERYGRMPFRSDAVLSLRNREDIALGFYPLRKFNSEAALARVGLTNGDRSRLGGLNPKLTELDVTAVIGSGHVWQHYFTRPEIASVIAPYVYYTDQQFQQPVAAHLAQPGDQPLQAGNQRRQTGRPVLPTRRPGGPILPAGAE